MPMKVAKKFLAVGVSACLVAGTFTGALAVTAAGSSEPKVLFEENFDDLNAIHQTGIPGIASLPQRRILHFDSVVAFIHQLVAKVNHSVREIGAGTLRINDKRTVDAANTHAFVKIILLSG